jgi:hypothetical protein
MSGKSFVAAAVAVCAAGSPQAATPLADDALGMTCRHYVYGADLEWLRPGGDWIDASGKPYGDMPIARPGGSDAGQVQWDVTSLAQAWTAGDEPKGAIYLRSLSGKARPVDFHSRESPDRTTHPSLAVEWSDGTQSRLSPSADTYFSCSSYRSKGRETYLRIGPGYPGLLVFPFEPRAGATVRRTVLSMTVKKPGNATIGAFRPAPPWSRAATRELGLAKRYLSDEGIERDPDVLFASDFDAPGWERKWSEHSRRSHAKIVADGGNGFEPIDGKALQVTIEQKGKLGLNMHYNFADHPGGEPEEAYFRYYLRFGENWGGREGGKLPGLSGTYDRAGWGMRRSDGTNGWSARGSFTPPYAAQSSLGGRVGVGSYVYQADMKKESGDHLGWNLGPSGLLHKNRWYSIEQYVKMNRPGEKDGVMRAWVDGLLVFEKTDLRFRDIPDLRIESLWMNVYHGGVRPTPKEMTLYIDNVVVARKYIGPMVK